MLGFELNFINSIQNPGVFFSDGEIFPLSSRPTIRNGGHMPPPGGASTFEGRHRLDTILHTRPYKVRYVTYTILILSIFLSYC